MSDALPQRYIHIKNLEKYHPGYKDRTLQWAKIYLNMAQGDPDCDLVSNEIDWARLLKMILLELRAQKPIPLNDEYLTKKGFDIKKRPMSLTIKMLHNFVDIVTEDSTLCHVEEEEDKDKDKSKRPQAASVTDQVGCIEYFKTQGSSEDQAKNFFDFYSSNGWVVGRARTPMKDWQAAARGWIRRAGQFQQPVSTDGVSDTLKKYMKPDGVYGRR